MRPSFTSLKILVVLLAVSWWGTIAATILMTALVVMATYSPGEFGDIALVGYARNLDASLLSAVSREGISAEIEFQNPVRLSVTLQPEYWESRRGLVALFGAVAVSFLVLFSFFIQQLRLMIRSVESGDPFVSENVKRVRVLGILILGGVAAKTLSELAMSGYADSVLKPAGFVLDGHIGVDFGSLIAGLSVIVLSEVFRIGMRMREDQELTI